MDTLTHVALGIGLGGLAYIDPHVAGSAEVASAVMACTIAAQQAPDADLVLRLFGNAVYTREHRGTSHSLPMLPIWALLVSGIVHLFFPDTPFWTLALWSFIGVVVHVASDIFNSYGTKALWPLSNRWIRLHVISIFDPFLFAMHALAILLWLGIGLAPVPIFIGLYLIVVGYYAWRCLERADLMATFMNSDTDTLTPSFSWTNWGVLRRIPGGSFQLGVLDHRELRMDITMHHSQHPAVEASKQAKEVAALLYFSDTACAQVVESLDGYRVRWVDVRFRIRQRFPFGVTVDLDRDLQVVKSKMGWN